MINRTCVSRRGVLGIVASAPVIYAKGKKIPIGLELFSVRNELQKDLMGTVKAVAKLGYDGVEFFSPYFQWTTDQAKDMRKLQDDLAHVFRLIGGPLKVR